MRPLELGHGVRGDARDDCCAAGKVRVQVVLDERRVGVVASVEHVQVRAGRRHEPVHRGVTAVEADRADGPELAHVAGDAAQLVGLHREDGLVVPRRLHSAEKVVELRRRLERVLVHGPPLGKCPLLQRRPPVGDGVNVFVVAVVVIAAAAAAVAACQRACSAVARPQNAVVHLCGSSQRQAAKRQQAAKRIKPSVHGARSRRPAAMQAVPRPTSGCVTARNARRCGNATVAGAAAPACADKLRIPSRA